MKQEIIDSISRVLESAASWRRATATRFPDDPRNIKAARTLDKLAADAADLTDEQWAELKPHYGGWDSEAWRRGLSQTARQVGFWNRSRDLNAFTKVLVRNCSDVAA